MQSIEFLDTKGMSLQQYEEELSRNNAMTKMPKNIEILDIISIVIVQYQNGAHHLMPD